MIRSVVLLPHPPVLLRELSGVDDVVAELRAACRAVLRDALTPAPEVVIVAGRDEAWFHPLTKRARPLAYQVADRLLADVGWQGPTRHRGLIPDATRLSALAEELRGEQANTVVLAMGDGSARRGEKAPGHLDERAAPFDQAVLTAVRAGDAEALTETDLRLADELLAAGAPAYVLMGRLGDQGVAAVDVGYAADPFGVAYVVAQWRLADFLRAAAPVYPSLPLPL